MVWEAHKCTIRGELIKWGSKRKKEREDNILKLVKSIHTLEAQHKHSLSTLTAGKLLEARKELQHILDAKAKHMLFFKQKLYYESGNKLGRLLARALKEHVISNNIAGIKKQNGETAVTTEAIAAQFQEFYTKLYNLPPQHKPQDMVGDRSRLIQDFLIKSGLLKIQELDVSSLDAPITQLEIY